MFCEQGNILESTILVCKFLSTLESRWGCYGVMVMSSQNIYTPFIYIPPPPPPILNTQGQEFYVYDLLLGFQLCAALNINKKSVDRDLDVYRNLLSKLVQAKELLKEYVEREKKKREERSEPQKANEAVKNFLAENLYASK
ncbi:putative protein Thf1 [Helianthus annuus]|nr:putative protein Thf1 [Helianthus annuus]